MILDSFDYIVRTERAGAADADALGLLLANGRAHTAEHVKAVAQEAVRIAERFGLNGRVLHSAGYLHDVSAVI